MQIKDMLDTIKLCFQVLLIGVPIYAAIRLYELITGVPLRD